MVKWTIIKLFIFFPLLLRFCSPEYQCGQMVSFMPVSSFDPPGSGMVSASLVIHLSCASWVNSLFNLSGKAL